MSDLTPVQRDALSSLASGRRMNVVQAGGLFQRRTLNALVAAGYATRSFELVGLSNRPTPVYAITEAGVARARG